MSSIAQTFPARKAPAYVQCPICPALHPIIVITVEQRPDFEAVHTAHFRCGAIGAQKSARLEVWPAAAKEAAP